MEILKKLWENKMTRMFLITVVGLILLIIIIAVVSLNSGGSGVTEKKLISATKKYLTDNISLAPKNDYDSRTVTLSTLVANGYISSSSEGASCASYVSVVKLDSKYYYTPYIKCSNSNDSSLLKTKLVSNVVESGQGLYNYNGSYIFRGENPNNYVTLNDRKWRIIGLDANSNIKIIYSDLGGEYKAWDDRYNSTLDRQSGINDYSLSRVKEYLDSYLDTMFDKKTEMFPNEVKVRLAKFSQCVGKIDIENNITDGCKDVIEDQLVGIITANDYVDASLDTSCTISNVKNCQNYNFLNNNSWTASAYNGNNVSIYYIDKNNGLKLSEAYIARAVYPVITLKSDVIYVSGTGTETNPYELK